MPQDRRTEKLEEVCTPTHARAHSWVSWAACQLHSPVSRGVYTEAGAGKALTTYTHQHQGLEKWDTAGKWASLCGPIMVWYPGCRTQMQDTPASTGWRDPCIIRHPWISTGMQGLSLKVVPTGTLVPGLCQHHNRDGAAVLLQLGGLLPSGIILTPYGSAGRGRKA